MKTFVIGDIHGGLKALKQLIQLIAINRNDTLIFLGDYVDGWSESPHLLDFLIELNKKLNCIYIKGNHDDLLLKYLRTNQYNEEWFLHGGKATIDSYKIIDHTTKQKHIAFLEKLLPYYIDNQNRLFIHAGFTNLKGVQFEYFEPLYYWDRTLWEMALATDNSLSKNDINYPSRFKIYNEIYIGHTPTTRINKTVPVNKACVWNIDTGAAFKGPLTAIDVDTKEFWQSDPVYQLYPDEKGRNE
jgi:serine/threonine protein phosphatase 1